MSVVLEGVAYECVNCISYLSFCMCVYEFIRVYVRVCVCAYVCMCVCVHVLIQKKVVSSPLSIYGLKLGASFPVFLLTSSLYLSTLPCPRGILFSPFPSKKLNFSFPK